MQALPRGFSINRSHPDAPACVVAIPFVERGGTVVRDVAARGRGSGAISGTGGLLNSDWTTHRFGHGLSVAGGTGVLAANAVNLSKGDGMAVMCAVTWRAINASFSAIVATSGWMFVNDNSGNGAITYSNTGGTNYVVGSQAPTVGVAYRVGIRFRTGVAGSLETFMNGVKASLVLTPSAFASSATKIASTSVFAGTNDMIISDVRIFDRWMPDAAFERNYRTPNAFYIQPRPVLRRPAAGGAGSMFFPFLHPSLQG